MFEKLCMWYMNYFYTVQYLIDVLIRLMAHMAQNASVRGALCVCASEKEKTASKIQIWVLVLHTY